MREKVMNPSMALTPERAAARKALYLWPGEHGGTGIANSENCAGAKKTYGFQRSFGVRP